MKGRTVILGVNERIGQLVQLLRDQGQEIVVVSNHVERFSRALDGVAQIAGDFIDPHVLRQAEVASAQSVVILAETIGHRMQDADARSVVATLSVERQNPEVRTVVEALSEDTAFHLRNAGVDEIIVSGELTADILAFSTTTSEYSQYLGVLLKFAHENRVVTAPVRERLVGKSLQALVRLLSEERKVLLGVRPSGGSGRASLDPERIVTPGDELVYIDIL